MNVFSRKMPDTSPPPFLGQFETRSTRCCDTHCPHSYLFKSHPGYVQSAGLVRLHLVSHRLSLLTDKVPYFFSSFHRLVATGQNAYVVMHQCLYLSSLAEMGSRASRGTKSRKVRWCVEADRYGKENKMNELS